LKTQRKALGVAEQLSLTRGWNACHLSAWWTQCVRQRTPAIAARARRRMLRPEFQDPVRASLSPDGEPEVDS
jgi:hypothetical protein